MLYYDIYDAQHLVEKPVENLPNIVCLNHLAALSPVSAKPVVVINGYY